MAVRTHFQGIGAAPLVIVSMLILCGASDPARGEASAIPSAKGRPACDRTAFRVVVDVGHTAGVPGARSARAVPEYEYNLRLAKEIEHALIEAGFARTVLLITTEPPRRGLFVRVEHAGSLAADLFLSIHHDSVPNRFLEKWEFEGEEYSFSDRFKGHSIFISNDNADRAGSLQFARLLGLQLKAHGLQYSPHYAEALMGDRRRELLDAAAGVYRYDQLAVLKFNRMPAVLLEAGSIINRDEELELRSPERRALISTSVTDAVTSFCTMRARRSQTLATKHQAKPARRRGFWPWAR